jgi:hypothetical protein
MKNSHIAAFVAAAAIGCAIPAWAVGPSENAPDPTVKSHANQTTEGTGTTQSTGSSDQKKIQSPAQNKSAKHPPTAIMDRATPPEKSSEEGQGASKHPPGRAMEKAVPDQKAPDGSKKPDSQG